jgi:hypothetical protein
MSSFSSRDSKRKSSASMSPVDKNAETDVRERVAELVGLILARYWIRTQTSPRTPDDIEIPRVDERPS